MKSNNERNEEESQPLDKSLFHTLSFESLRKLKIPFDKLKTYSEKLKFWDEYFWGEKGYFHFSWSYFFNEIDTEQERLKPENFITIYPDNKSETEQFNSWLFNHIQNDKETEFCNFGKVKETYYEKIKDNPRAIEYIEQQIEAITTQRDRERKYMTEQRDTFFWGYYLGYQTVVQKTSFPLQMDAEELNRIILSVAKGICDAHYLGFLENELAQRKNEMPSKRTEAKIETASKEDSEKYTRQVLEFVAYLNQYISEGIKFNLFKTYETPISKEDKEDYGLKGEFLRISTIHSQEIDNEMIERFYNRRWMDREPLFIEKDFIEDELNFLNNLHDKVKKNYEMQFRPLVKFFKSKLQDSVMPNKKKKQSPQTNYTHKEVAIACFFMKVNITSENADKILREYSKNRSSGKFLQEKILKPSELTKLSMNKTADTKHLKRLENAKRLISSKKNKQALNDIDPIITAFQTAYDSYY